jgi:hypothetical protein
MPRFGSPAGSAPKRSITTGSPPTARSGIASAARALGFDAVRLVDGHLVFADLADQELCAGVWRVTEFRRNGNTTVEITIPAPVAAAA